MDIGIFLIATLLFLSILGLPIFLSMGIATLGAIVIGELPLIVMANRLFSGVNSFSLLAIPFFLLAGSIMANSINRKILDISNAMFGWIPGSLSIITTFSSAIFAAISGSGVATVSAIGGITIPGMIDEGYPKEFAASIASAASILGPIIPPSIVLIVYGSITGTSVARLFMASIVPGIGLTLAFALYAYILARIKGFPSYEFGGISNVFKKVKDGIWALLMPLIILGGIFLGIFTPTEAAAISVVYALGISVFVYKSLKFKDIMNLFSESAIVAATISILICISNAASWVIVVSGLPRELINFLESVTDSRAIIYIFVLILLLLIGTIIEANAAIVMVTPLLLPLMNRLGMSTIQFGVVMGMSFCIGLLTPPMGISLLVGNSIAKAKLIDTFKSTLPLLIISIIFLLLTVFIPGMTEWLPSLFY